MHHKRVYMYMYIYIGRTARNGDGTEHNSKVVMLMGLEDSRKASIPRG